MDKETFLKEQFIPLLQNIPSEQMGGWGRMNFQQMVEHLAHDAFDAASGIVIHDLITPEEKIPAMQAFVLSDIPFKENTKNALMSESPKAVLYADINEALDALHVSKDQFFKVFEQNNQLKIMNPFFGLLDYNLSIHLLYKHVLHHLKQFNIPI